MLKAGDDGNFKLAFVQLRSARQIEKFENVRVLEHIYWSHCLRRLAPRLEGGFVGAANEQSLVKKAADLALQVAARPVGAHCFSLVELPSSGIGHPHQGPVMRPAEIGIEGD